MNNIFQVLTEMDFMNCLEKYNEQLIVTLFMSNKIKYKHEKKKLANIAKTEPNLIFLYIERENFLTENGSALADYNISPEIMPVYFFFYNKEKLKTLNNYTEDNLELYITQLKKFIIELNKCEKQIDTPEANNIIDVKNNIITVEHIKNLINLKKNQSLKELENNNTS